MKRIFLVFLSALLVVSMLSVTAFASTEERVLTLPEDDGTGYPVTGIAADSYRDNDDATKLIVPENIVRLGERAFWGCSNMEQIKLHDKIQMIGAGAFEATAYYKDKSNWEDGVLYIGDCLIKADPKEIADTYTIRNGTRLIAAGAFEDCENLNAVTIPKTIEFVGEKAFLNTAFFNDENNWVDNILCIDYLLIAANEKCTGPIAIPDGIKTIADSAFSHCKITKVSSPSSLKHIGQNAFFDCQDLTEIELGENVLSLGRGPMRMCDSLQEIKVHDANLNFEVVDGILFNEKLSSVIRCPQKKFGEVILPHSVTKINAYAFELCTEITSVEIPKGCLFIGNSAFSICEELSELVLPESLEYIDQYAFAYCNGIEAISIPDNIYLGKYAFTCCMNLKEVEIGKGITELREGLFESAEKLNVVKLGEGIENISDSAFRFTKYISNISNYQNGMLISDQYLIKVAKDVTECYVPSGIKVIADCAFEYPAEEGCLREVHIPSTISKFSWGAFYDIKHIPVYYSGSLSAFIKTTDFDWDSINLFTSDFNSGIWIVIATFVGLIVLSTGIIVDNFIKKRKCREEMEEHYGEE